MIELFELSNNHLQKTKLDFFRSLYKNIDWNSRLIGIKGARGTGKTTMLLQYLIQLDLPKTQKLYISLDDIYFTNHSLVEVGKTFYLQGGKILALDEVHKYPNWSQEIKNLYDRYNDLKIIFTGSSIVDITKNEGDLSRRAVMYELKGLSFREYLDLAEDIRFNELSLEEILDEDFVFSELFPSDFKPYEYFNEYLKTGYYPFFLESKITYYQRLKQLVRLVVELDMAEIKGLDIRQSKKILQLLYIISQQVPFSPNLSDLARKTTIHRNSLNDYLYYLEEARLLYLLQTKNYSVASLQKPEKIYLNNTNLLYALSEDNPNSGTIREVFFYNQLAGLHQISQSKEADFLVDNKYTFEIGGKNKTMTQIKNVENSWLVKDDIIQPTGRAIPLWMFGFLY
jgi:hypothetical protein